MQYRFEQFDLQPRDRLLMSGGTPVALTPRAFDLLVALVEREGRLASKDDLLAQVWPGVIVEENSLQRHISVLRKVLGADAITTVSGAGYRFALGVVRAGEGSVDPPGAAPRHNLVRHLTTFVGRESQLAELKELLRRTQLITLSGAGGCGKTRLALELASSVVGAYADGVWLVELAALADGELVPQAAADALGLKERAGETLMQTLLNHLGPKQLLLVIDNAEHLLAPCGELVRTLLQRCAGLSILVTSRERLAVPGELTYRVPSLSRPDPNKTYAAEALAAYESARLFVERARLQQPRFEVTADNASAIASICAQLDGIPLAIELAAARVRALSVREVNERLDQRFRLLTSNASAALPRQRTLRALIDWSYDLLNEEEKAVLCRASVFAGGFTLASAERVLTADKVDEAAVLDLLTSLTDKSLLQADEHAGATRYRQLDTVRQYGRDRLRETGDESSWERRHLECFLALAELAEDGLRGSERHAWLQRLEAEHDNIAAALAAASRPDGDHLVGLRLAGTLFPFWWLSGLHLSEGRAWLSRFLDLSPFGSPHPTRAKALNAAGMLAHYLGDVAAARTFLEESVGLRRKLRVRRDLAAPLNNLANVLVEAGDMITAHALLEESLAITREVQDRWGRTRVLISLVELMCDERDTRRARSLAQECIEIAREYGGPVLANGLSLMAGVLLVEGDAQGATVLCREAIVLGNADRVTLHDVLDTAACADCDSGRPIRAAVIWGYVERRQREMGVRRWRAGRRRHERSVASARASLADDAAFDAAWRGGAGMTTDEIVSFVLETSDDR